MSGVVVLADVIPGMGALMSLDLSSNYLTGGYPYNDMPGNMLHDVIKYTKP
jgi:hypothetical protein